VRVAVTRNGATMADGGSVQRLFSRKGVIEVAKRQEGRALTEDDLLEATLEANPEEIVDQGEGFTVLSDPNDMVEVRKAIQAAGLDYESADVAFVASFDQIVDDVEQANKLERIIDALEDLDDVQNVYTNAQYSDAVEAALNEED
jgi:transcriptional/translational regulatory protein YebC/TACO1